MIDSLQTSLQFLTTQLLTDALAVLPRILGAFAALIIGSALARFVRSVLTRLMTALNIGKAIRKTPVDLFFKNAGFHSSLEDIAGSVGYWLVMLITAHTFVTILGLQSLTTILDRIISYLPNIVTAIVVLLFGVLLAGFLENVVKGAVRSFDSKSARLLGKISSYLVMVFAVLAAVSELGIARDFILILFIGFVTMVSLGLGLAIGLGAKDLVGVILSRWYKRLEQELR